MSKSNGADLRDHEKAVLAIKPLTGNSEFSVSSVCLLLLFNQLNGDVKKFKCQITEILVSVSTENFIDPMLENFVSNLEHLKNVPIRYLVNLQAKTNTRTHVTGNHHVLDHVRDRQETAHVKHYVITGFTTTTIAGTILSNITDGVGEHISLDAIGHEIVIQKSQAISFLKPFRDLSKTDLLNLIKLEKFQKHAICQKIKALHSVPKSLEAAVLRLNKPQNCSTSAVLAKELRNFLNDLDAEYPSQIFAVYRIGVKLVGDNQLLSVEDEQFCVNCYRPKNYNYDSSALTALNFCQQFDKNKNFKVEDLLNENFESEIFDPSGVYGTDKKLCFRCESAK